MILGVHHTALSVADLDRTIGFYRDVLGAEVCSEFGWESGADVLDGILSLKSCAAKVAMIRLGNLYFEIFEFSSPEAAKQDFDRPVCDHGYTHISLEVDDIEKEYERLKAAGMVFHCEPQFMGEVAATYGRDPDGNVIELMQIMSDDYPAHHRHLEAFRKGSPA